MAIRTENAFASVVHSDDGANVSRVQVAFASVVHTGDGANVSRIQVAFASIVHAEGQEGGDPFPPFTNKMDQTSWIGTAVAKLWRGSNDS